MQSSPIQVNNEIIQTCDQTDVDTSSESFFHLLNKKHSQPDFTYTKPDLTRSLAELSGAKPLYPIATVPPRIITEKVIASSLAEFADPNIFLTDITINAFCVSLQ